MAFYNGTIYSRVLEMDTALGVFLPHDSRVRKRHLGIYEDVTVIPPAKPKTLILLHGLSDNYLVWMAKTSLIRYAEEHDVAVLMPEVARSFYQDMKYGRDYFRYISEELPAYAAEAFQISVAPEDLMVAGLSMGGYGALRCGLTYPDRYCGIGAFSSGWNLQDLYFNDHLNEGGGFSREEKEKDRIALWGDAKQLPEEADILKLMDQAVIPESWKLYIGCGTEDFLYEDHKLLKQQLTAHGIPFANSEMPGIHEWAVWDRLIREFLDYLILGKKPEEKLN